MYVLSHPQVRLQFQNGTPKSHAKLVRDGVLGLIRDSRNTPSAKQVHEFIDEEGGLPLHSPAFNFRVQVL